MSNYILHIDEYINIRTNANVIRNALPKILDDVYAQHIKKLTEYIHIYGAVVFSSGATSVSYPTYYSGVIEHHKINYCMCSITTSIIGNESFWETFICDPIEVEHLENH